MVDVFLMVQFGGDTTGEADQRAHDLINALKESEHDPRFNGSRRSALANEDELWQVREAGLGATAHVPGRARHLGGLGGFGGRTGSSSVTTCAGLHALYQEFGYASEARAQPLRPFWAKGASTPGSRSTSTTADGVADYHRFLARAADLVVEFGGSLSGEHGDGQTRGELLPKMFGASCDAGLRRVEGPSLIHRTG